MFKCFLLFLAIQSHQQFPTHTAKGILDHFYTENIKRNGRAPEICYLKDLKFWNTLSGLKNLLFTRIHLEIQMVMFAATGVKR
jgi:hypothetical protein